MKISTVETECRDKVSPNCTQVFNREIKRGRPQVNCEACKNFKAPVTTFKVTKRAAEPKAEIEATIERICPCGNKFYVKPGRGRKAEKCESCRNAGVVYRTNSDGDMETIDAERLAEEQRAARVEAGNKRAAALVEMMKPLLSDKKERVVIHH